jgi:hypothetical protein
MKRLHALVARTICSLWGHRRHSNSKALFYWHSHERCARCKELVDSPMVSPGDWA